ncbi:MAG: hypothetical protein Q8N13_13630 [Acidovorax sp.]|nr:hypothetical protein [Acidovorax sp.]
MKHSFVVLNATHQMVKVSFMDSSGDKAGSVTVSLVNGYPPLKARGLRLLPVGMHNTGPQTTYGVGF